MSARDHVLGLRDWIDFLGKEADNSLDAIVSLDLIEHVHKPQVCRLAVSRWRAC